MSFGPPDILAPLTSLLGIRAGMHVSVRNPPKGFLEALLPLPEGAALLDAAKLGLDAIILFTDKKLEVIDQLTRLVTLMSVTGAIWVVFPTGEVPTAPSEDFVRLAGLELGLEDTKRVFLGPHWVGLKLQWRRGSPRLEKPQAQA
ncbi:MAG: DUF3052 domain-containing protein [Myxococcales bacterium]|nr:DUF3052 domain-containing protein [Myxococcales bacterium]